MEAKFTRTIPGIPGYEADADGGIWSVAHKWRGHRRRKMVPSLDIGGYALVRLTIDGKRTKHRVHHLVAMAFIGPRPTEQHEMRHLNGNRTDNRAENLRWGTCSENAQDRVRHGNQFIPPWGDKTFRKKAISGMLRAHARNRIRKEGRYAEQ